MKMILLRKLLRELRRVEWLTRAGCPVQVIERGNPLWVLGPAEGTDDEAARDRGTEEILEEALKERPSKVSALRLLEESRR